MHNGSEQLSLLSLVVLLTFYEQNGKCFYRRFQGIFKIFRKLSNALKFNQAHIFFYPRRMNELKTVFSSNSVCCVISELTLKQTQSEKGSVARTMAQEMAVRIQPHRPIPSSVSSAETKKSHYSHWLWHYGWPNTKHSKPVISQISYELLSYLIAEINKNTLSSFPEPAF